MIKWINELEKEGIVTCYSTNMTFNSIASISLFDAYKVQVGVDDDRNIIVKPLSKDRYSLGDIDPHSCFDVANKKSYSRISSTSLMSTLGKMLNINFSSIPKKYKSIYDEENECLIIKVSKEVN